jgi:hypothetical protein
MKVSLVVLRRASCPYRTPRAPVVAPPGLRGDVIVKAPSSTRLRSGQRATTVSAVEQDRPSVSEPSWAAGLRQMRAPEYRSVACLERTNSRSTLRLDGVNAVHRHDAGAREIPTGCAGTPSPSEIAWKRVLQRAALEAIERRLEIRLAPLASDLVWWPTKTS